MKQVLLIFILVLTSICVVQGEDYKALNDKGVAAYKNRHYDTSLQYFNKAQNLNPQDKVIDFNLGNALHQEGQYDQALKNYESAAIAGDTALKAEAYYNMGNTQFRAGALDKAVENYKKTLSLNPKDKDAKYNLELALKKLEEQKQQQKQDKNQKQDQQKKDQQDQKQNQSGDQKQKDQQQQSQQDQKRQDQKQDQKQQDQQQQNDQKNQDQQKQNQDQQNKQDQKQNQKQPNQEQRDSLKNSENPGQTAEGDQRQLDEERAQALLQGLNQDEKEVMKDLLRRKIGIAVYKGKGW